MEDIRKYKKEWQARWRAKNIEHSRSVNRKSNWKFMLKKVYGITPDDYMRILSEQNEACAICGKHQSEFNRSLAVDHNHETQQIRGLLCVNCNSAIGKLKEDIGLLGRATTYLQRWNNTSCIGMSKMTWL